MSLKGAQNAGRFSTTRRDYVFYCILAMTLGETVQWAVTFGILVHFSLLAKPTRRLREQR